jgi:uncharacterized protein YdhG (YjbR/CyaY superfamily)
LTFKVQPRASEEPNESRPRAQKNAWQTESMKELPRPKNVDAYIAAAPQDVRRKLEALRTAIRQVAPTAEERISYGMPYYAYKGRLAYFATFKEHIGLYVPPPVIAEHKRELRDYKTAVAAVRFPLDKKLPIALIKKLIRARLKWNEARDGKQELPQAQ